VLGQEVIRELAKAGMKFSSFAADVGDRAMAIARDGHSVRVTQLNECA
jgi:hypothetical protein